jgi:hypothetical protein
VTILSRARALFQSPADRRLAEAKAEAWADADKPLRSPSHALAATAALPPIDWMRADREPGPDWFTFTPGYNDRTLENRSAPQSFEGFDLARIRNAVALHRLGNFYESSTMAVALMSFAPVLAALQQATARILATPRHIKGGERGLARLVAREIEEAVVPQGSLLPSPYVPPELWGTTAIYLRNMGFCVHQHVDGKPDKVTGVRPRYTRIWEPWAVRRTRNPAKWLAITTAGEVEILNDGKFTLVIDENEGHLTGAVVALGEPVLGGIVTMCARNGWLDFFGDPKLYATLPEKVPTQGEAGNAFEAAVETIYGPAGRGVLPFGSTLQAVALPGVGASQFREALYDSIALIGMIYLGSGGTMSNEGVYVSPGFFGVQHDLIARPVACMVRGLNQGHIAPYCDINYGAQIEAAKRAGTWKYPILGVDLADPDQASRIESVVKRETARTDILVKRRDAGIDTTQDDADKLSEDLDLRSVQLMKGRRGAKIEQWHVENKQIAPDEVREDLGFDPLPDGSGSVAKLAEERADGKDKTGPAPSEGSGDGRSHERGGGGSSTGPAAILAVSRGSIRGKRGAMLAALKVAAYSDDQERDDDGKFGSGGGSGGGYGSGGGDGGKGKDPPKESGGDKPERTKHEAAREGSTKKEADDANKNFERLSDRKDDLQKRHEEADEKAVAARELAEKTDDEWQADRKSRPDPNDDTRSDEELAAEEKADREKSDEIDRLFDEAERLESASSALSWRLDSAESQHHFAAQASDDADAHATMAKLPDAEYGKQVTERADAAPGLTLKANQAALDAPADEREWRERDATVMAESQERWEGWRDKWEAGPDAKPAKEAPPTTGPDTSLARKAEKSAASSAKVADKADARATSSEAKAADARAKADAASGDRKEQLDARATEAEENAREHREDHADKAAKASNDAEHAKMAKLPDDEYERDAYARIDKADDDLDAAQVREEKARKGDDDAATDALERASARAQADVDYWNEMLDAYYEAKPKKK